MPRGGPPAIKSSTSPGPHKKWTAAQLRALLAELRAHMAEGKTDLLIMEEMSLTPGEYNILKKEFYSQEKLELAGRGPEEVYIDYMLQQRQCIKDLDGLLGKFVASKQYNGIVGAIRAKSDILDKIIAKGQELKVLNTEPEAKKVVAGLMVSSMTADELRTTVTKQVAQLGELLGKYGETDMLGAPIAPVAAAGTTAPAPGPATPRPVSVPAAATSATSAPKPSPRPVAVPAKPATPAAPAFSAANRPGLAKGGLSKSVGARASNQRPTPVALVAPPKAAPAA